MNTDEQIMTALHVLRNKTGEQTEEQDWILTHLNDRSLCEKAEQLSVVCLHILSALVNQDLTGIELANKLSVTRGGITQAANRLQKLTLIQSYQQSCNHKKIYYQLTADGRNIAEVHTHMHALMNEQLSQKVFAHYSEQEKQTILHFITEMTDFSALN